MALKLSNLASKMERSSEAKYSKLQQTDYIQENGIRAKRRSSDTLRMFMFLGIAPLCFAFGFLASQLRESAEETGWTTDLPRLKRTPTRFNGSFEFTNRFRGKPSPELDYEWNRFTAHPFSDGTASLISVNLEDIKGANKTSDIDWLNSTVKYEENNGGGYMATLELFHQLHCLNMLRKAIHQEYYAEMRPLANGSYTHNAITHLDHCVEILRQVLNCHADTGLITYHWVEGNPVAYPDFNTWHQCRNPEDVLAWSKAREADISTRPKKGLNVIEMPSAP